MAKNNMKIKYKEPKRNRNSKKEVQNENPIKSFLLTLLYVVIALVIAYLLMLGMKALGAFEKGYTPVSKEEPQFSSEYITISTVFNRPEKNYYVIFDNYESEYTKDAYVNALLDKQDKLRVYKVDMSSNENSKYLSEEENRNAETSSDLKIKGVTLIKVSSGKLVKYLSGSDEIEEYLNK